MKIGRPEKHIIVPRDDLLEIFRNFIKISPHPLPEDMVGNLYSLDGVSQAADEIMARINIHIEKYYVKKSDIQENT